MAKRLNWKTVDVSTLTLDNDMSWGWTYSKTECYLLRISETENFSNRTYVQLGYYREQATDPWKLQPDRYLRRVRRQKYLAINGPEEGKKVLPGRDGYHKFYGYGSDGFPDRFCIHTESMAKRLGLVW
jgi:hypothetical protein